MKVLIIEDELPASQRLERLLKEFDESIEIVGVLESIEDSTNWFFQNSHPDLIFMDTSLMTGLASKYLKTLK